MVYATRLRQLRQTHAQSNPTRWSRNVAYIVGIFVTDGNVSKDGRHLHVTNMDREILEHVKKVCQVRSAIKHKVSGDGLRRVMYLQWSSVAWHAFFVSIGVMPAKTKIISDVDIPDEYFYDFLRGHFDGDGSFYSYKDPRWTNSHQFYLTFTSASKKHIHWLRSSIAKRLGIRGSLTRAKKQSTFLLRYAKRDSVMILQKMYQTESRILYLERKYMVIHETLKRLGYSLTT